MGRHVSVEAFAAGTPEVTVAWIDCEKCGSEYLGYPDNEPVCPSCEAGIDR